MACSVYRTTKWEEKEKATTFVYKKHKNKTFVLVFILKKK